MARILPRSLTNVRHLLLTLLTLGLVLRMGGTCEAMAATPATPAAISAHCADMPTKPGKPVKSEVATCALCIALPDATVAKVDATPFISMQPVAALQDRLAGLAGGPAPPPPKIA